MYTIFQCLIFSWKTSKNFWQKQSNIVSHCHKATQGGEQGLVHAFT